MRLCARNPARLNREPLSLCAGSKGRGEDEKEHERSFEIGISFGEICISFLDLHKSGLHLPISLAEICIFVREIGISAFHLCKGKLHSYSRTVACKEQKNPKRERGPTLRLYGNRH